MIIRYSKIIASAFMGFYGFICFLNNLFNLNSAFTILSLVMTNPPQPMYSFIGPSVTAPWLIWTGVVVIMATEFTVGVLGISGAVRMFKHRAASLEIFHAAKWHAILSAIFGMIVWYGYFTIIGEGYFHMWQHLSGVRALTVAFRSATVCAVFMLFIALKDD
jgi:predicted small integral membrane protein